MAPDFEPLIRSYINFRSMAYILPVCSHSLLGGDLVAPEKYILERGMQEVKCVCSGDLCPVCFSRNIFHINGPTYFLGRRVN